MPAHYYILIVIAAVAMSKNIRTIIAALRTGDKERAKANGLFLSLQLLVIALIIAADKLLS